MKTLKRIWLNLTGQRELTACESLIESYKDLTPAECDYIFDVMSDKE